MEESQDEALHNDASRQKRPKCVQEEAEQHPPTSIEELPAEMLRRILDQVELFEVVPFVCKLWQEHLKILEPNGWYMDMDSNLCTEAARKGHLEVLRWAHQNGCPWDGRTCARAAEGGHLEVLQWAHENGCPWDSCTCTNAASKGHLEVLQWAYLNGCPCNFQEICREAAHRGHEAVLPWALKQGTLNLS